MREGGEEGRMGGGLGARGAQGRVGPGRLGWAGLGWVQPLRGLKTHDVRGPLNGIKSRIEIRNGTRRTLNIKQRNVLRHDATPMILRFWFIHDTDTYHYTGFEIGKKERNRKRKESNARIW